MATIAAQIELKTVLKKQARAYRNSPDPNIGIAAGEEEVRLQSEIDALRKSRKNGRGKNGKN